MGSEKRQAGSGKSEAGSGKWEAGGGKRQEKPSRLGKPEERSRVHLNTTEASRERFFGLGASGSQMAPALGPVVGRGAAYNYDAIRQAGQHGVETVSAAASGTGRAARGSLADVH